MFKIKKIIALLLVFTFLFSFKASANNNTEIAQSSISATVLQIIDTDSIKVSLDGSNQIAFVKLKGIKGNAFNEGYEYLTNTILGEKVTLVKDNFYFDGKWNYMNVYYNGLNINNELVFNGYAIVDKTQTQGSNYNTLISNQNIANSYALGIWENQSPSYSSVTDNSINSYYTKDRVNINTASLSQIKSLLKGVPSTVADNIIYYRERNPFTTIQEIKFVKGFTKEMYDQNKNIMCVSTNINKANEYELVTLGLSSTQINALLELRNKKDISDTSDLIPTVLSSSEYTKLKPFISTIDQNEISYIISSSI
ncbi:MAG: helix-hairpin-helix domain-containing protein, partial [Eubacteriales bacterium]|nr:helix-hairpin-helix domain-containing protein [Eubacteriales bacterium]